MHSAVILLGSNISPQVNVRVAVDLLSRAAQLTASSSVWETSAVGSSGPNFLNLAVEILTELDADALKWQVLRPIEEQMGRVRVKDKNAPRTIDLDTVIFDGAVLDHNLWKRAYIALPVAELRPALVDPLTGFDLKTLAEQLRQGEEAVRLGHLSLPG